MLVKVRVKALVKAVLKCLLNCTPVTTPRSLCSRAISLQSDSGIVGTDPLAVEYIRSGHSKVWQEIINLRIHTSPKGLCRTRFRIEFLYAINERSHILDILSVY